MGTIGSLWMSVTSCSITWPSSGLKKSQVGTDLLQDEALGDEAERRALKRYEALWLNLLHWYNSLHPQIYWNTLTRHEGWLSHVYISVLGRLSYLSKLFVTPSVSKKGPLLAQLKTSTTDHQPSVNNFAGSSHMSSKSGSPSPEDEDRNQMSHL